MLDDTEKDQEFQVSSPDIKITSTEIDGLIIFEKKLYQDDRGWFQEGYRVDDIAKALGVSDLEIKQGSFTYNLPGALRGLHAEPQYKIVTPLTGKAFIAIADIRIDSLTFGKVQTFMIDNSDPQTPRKSLVISPGLANSILVVGSEPVLYHYAVSSTFKFETPKRSVAWNDPTLNIDWPVHDPIISPADQKNPTLKKLFPEKFS